MSGSRKVDLALPNALPLADVLPQVLRFCLTADDAHRPQAWSLARLGGVPLPLTQTLAEVGVGDGEVLELRGQAAAVRPALVEDVRDAVEDSVDVAGGWWTPSTT
ncbi:MAG: EsaB/YukD family protein, partial [Nocardioidaceae bacterium]|nr:EsaB/YukD family protein [Nocardioidaceae bacterium]